MSLIDKFEKAIRKAIASVSDRGCSEKAYYEQLDEALDVIREGVTMRLQELEKEDEEDE